MQNRVLGLLLLALGLLGVLAAVFADLLFGGAGRHMGFGNLQILVLVAGLLVAATGGWLTRKS